MGAQLEHKDVVLALLGAGSALAGLALVFLGLVVTGLQSYPPGTKKAILDRYRRPGLAVLLAFTLGIACVACAACWLVLSHDNHAIYLATIWFFGALLLTLLIATIWSVRRIMWS